MVMGLCRRALHLDLKPLQNLDRLRFRDRLAHQHISWPLYVMTMTIYSLFIPIKTAMKLSQLRVRNRQRRIGKKAHPTRNATTNLHVMVSQGPASPRLRRKQDHQTLQFLVQPTPFYPQVSPTRQPLDPRIHITKQFDVSLPGKIPRTPRMVWCCPPRTPRLLIER